MATTIRLWRHLFAADQRLVGPAADESEDWPESLGPRPGDAVFDWLSGNAGACWLGDEEARAALAKIGAKCPAPSPEVVGAVHDKAFAARFADAAGYLPACLRGLPVAYSPEELGRPDAWLADFRQSLAGWPPWTGGRFTLKPRLGSSGRGRVGGLAHALEEEKVRAALPRLAQRGGALLEPWLERGSDLSVMLHIAEGAASPDAPITLLGSAEQIVAPSGVYLGHLGEIDSRGRVFSGDPADEAMREAAAALAQEARAAGYWGPCGLDGFEFRGPASENGEGETRLRLRPIVEFNARFTVGIVVLGLLRRALAQVGPRLGIEPGERRGFLFALDPPGNWPDWEAAASAAGAGTLALPLGGRPGGPGLLFAREAQPLRAALVEQRAGPG